MKKFTSRPQEAGASMVEYVMLLAFVAVLGIIGLRTVGPVAAGMFSAERLGLATPPATAPAKVLGVTVERPHIAPCQPTAGAGVYPTCPL